MVISKYCASGNDFLIFHTFDSENLRDYASDLCRKLCNRFYGIGADGLVVLVPCVQDVGGSQGLGCDSYNSNHALNPVTHPNSKKKISYKWHFYNSDGSVARMCGNASRAVGLYAFHNRLAGLEHSFLSEAGAVDVAIKRVVNDKEALVQSNLGGFVLGGSFVESKNFMESSFVDSKAQEFKDQESKKCTPRPAPARLRLGADASAHVDGKKYNFELITVGVPHLVHICNSRDEFDAMCGDVGFLSYLRHKYDANVSLCFRSENLENNNFENENLANKNLVSENLKSKIPNKACKTGQNENLPPKNRIEYATFERGVEGITQACGTGACAVYVAFRDFDVTYILIPPSGEELSVSICNNKVYFAGLVSKVCDCVI